jgi:hypothetical protein
MADFLWQGELCCLVFLSALTAANWGIVIGITAAIVAYLAWRYPVATKPPRPSSDWEVKELTGPSPECAAALRLYRDRLPPNERATDGDMANGRYRRR